ncbi:MAG TPA: secondary thiamine-phosphate synthase enzyme YjbQ [Bryobacteraceae bacterium]|jgi:secondary thiamine-phosphate synthase enzyme|nr:secondary thiamine-phosphate synthase enzyme YjbQ [Bryobacteraceae bacterium]
MKQAQGELKVATRGKGFYEITREVRKWIGGQGIRSGLLTVFIQHTSASLVIQENADADVRRDLAEFFERLVPESTPWFRHTTEGADDMPSHIRAALTATHLSIPVREGQAALGTWQGIYVFEHRAEPQTRQIALHLVGE